MDGATLPTRVLVRLAAVTSTVLALGAGAHLAAAGALPDGRVLLVLAAATAAVVAPLAHRRLRATTLLPVVAAWQWLLHQGLAATAHPVPPDVHHVHAAHASSPDPVGPLLMTAAHVLATVLTVALLVTTDRATDRALRRLAWAVPVLAGSLALTPPVAGRVPVTSRVATVVLPPRTLGAHGCRAPPRAVRAA